MPLPSQQKAQKLDWSTVLQGEQAVQHVSQMEGRPLSPKEARVIQLEGYVPYTYLDTKNVPTYGVGQTGKWMDKPFSETFAKHEDRARKAIAKYDELPEYLQAEIVQAEYRGDLGSSPTFRKLFNKGKYKEAAKEFLNHEEYLNPDTPDQIKRRIESVAKAVAHYAAGAKGK
jgi:GH24 family phage-related lysozyme (muramidase)